MAADVHVAADSYSPPLPPLTARRRQVHDLYPQRHRARDLPLVPAAAAVKWMGTVLLHAAAGGGEAVQTSRPRRPRVAAQLVLHRVDAAAAGVRYSAVVVPGADQRRAGTRIRKANWFQASVPACFVLNRKTSSYKVSSTFA